jgi:hypothetical protein
MGLGILLGYSMGAAVVQRIPGPAGEFDPRTLRPFTEGVPYLGRYETGLYPGGSNEMPEGHRRAGEQIAAGIRPLDTDGRPDDTEGHVLGLVMGHSNCRMYFAALQSHLGERAAHLNPRFELLNAAVGGQQLPQIVQLQGPVWERAEQLTGLPGRSPQQVQVLFLHTTYHGWRNTEGAPPGEFPRTMEQMQRDLIRVLEHCLHLYPNLRIAYLTCDGFRHFTGFEPHVYQEAFAVKWLIESQIRSEPGTAYQGEERRLPWLQWGPYVWDNTWDASYFTDGVHPGPAALRLFVDKYWEHLNQDRVAKAWLLKS